MSRRRNRLVAQVGHFMKEYGPKKRAGGWDPNDRHYDRALERELKRLRPEELDEFLHGDPGRTPD